MEMKLFKDTQAFCINDLVATLYSLGIEQSTILTVLHDPKPNGVRIFNSNSQEGAEIFKGKGWGEPRILAELFAEQDLGFDKHLLGEYLIEDHVLNRKHNLDKSFLHNLASMQDFRGQQLVASLRSFFTIFYAPIPEGYPGAPMDILIDQFAWKYYSDNPEHFVNCDCVSLLVASLHWLHAELSSKHEVTFETWLGFVAPNGLNIGVPRVYLKRLHSAACADPRPILLFGPPKCLDREPTVDHQPGRSMLGFVKQQCIAGRTLLSCICASLSNRHIHFA